VSIGKIWKPGMKLTGAALTESTMREPTAPIDTNLIGSSDAAAKAQV